MSANFALKRNREILRMGLRPVVSVALLMIATLVVGCASQASRGLLPQLEARHPPDIQLGPELILLEGPPILSTSLIDMDGVAHLFWVDEEKQLNHIEILGDEIVTREFLGRIEIVKPWTVIDAVEHPRGKLRVIVGDTQYFRKASNLKWQEIKGNRCTRFVPVGDDLFCAFVINGEEIAAPERTDYTVGWFLLVPIFSWSHKHASKLVLAQESRDSWIVRAVVDPDTPMDAEGDFMIGTDSLGNIHFLYFTSKGGGTFLLFAYGYSGVAEGSTPEPELRYAQLKFDQLLALFTDPQRQASGDNITSMQWLTIKGITLPHKPFIKKNLNNIHARIGLRPLNRNFSVNKVTGEVSGLMWASECILDDGDRQLRFLGLDHSCVEVNIRQKQWSPHFNIATAKDFPTANINWYSDENLLIRADSKGKYHVLLESTKIGFLKHNRHIHYLMKDDINWSVPLTLGSSHNSSYDSTLAVDEYGVAFAAWVNEECKFIGRWIRPCSIDLK